MSKDVVNISTNISSKEGFIAINNEFKKQSVLIETLQKELESKVKAIKDKGLSSEDFTKELKALLIKLKKLSLDSIYLDLKLTDVLDRYKEFTYDGSNNLTELNIYTSPAKNILLYNVVYDYTGDNISLITITRASDNVVYTKALSYDVNNNLINIDINII